MYNCRSRRGKRDRGAAEDERFTFYLQYDPNLKHDLLEVIETAGAEVVADDTEGHVLTVSTNMQQLALIKRVDGVERVRSNEGSNPFLMEEAAETQAEAQTAPRFADGNMTADAWTKRIFLLTANTLANIAKLRKDES